MFTEVLQSQIFYSSWQLNTEKIFHVQLRDAYGNIVLTNDDLVESTVIRIQGNKELKKVVVTPQENGIYRCNVMLDFERYRQWD